MKLLKLFLLSATFLTFLNPANAFNCPNPSENANNFGNFVDTICGKVINIQIKNNNLFEYTINDEITGSVVTIHSNDLKIYLNPNDIAANVEENILKHELDFAFSQDGWIMLTRFQAPQQPDVNGIGIHAAIVEKHSISDTVIYPHEGRPLKGSLQRLSFGFNFIGEGANKEDGFMIDAIILDKNGINQELANPALIYLNGPDLFDILDTLQDSYENNRKVKLGFN